MKILIVDDDALIREGLKILIGMEADFEVIGTANNGKEALDFCKINKPDLVLMDIRMPIMDGVQGTKEIMSRFDDIKIVILTTFKDDEYIKEALKSGARGYILKSQSSESIIESLRVVSKGNIVFEEEIAKSLTQMLGQYKTKQKINTEILPREMDVLRLIAEGLSNKEIAEKLYLSEGTVRNYVTDLLSKLELRDRTQLAIYFINNIK